MHEDVGDWFCALVRLQSFPRTMSSDTLYLASLLLPGAWAERIPLSVATGVLVTVCFTV